MRFWRRKQETPLPTPQVNVVSGNIDPFKRGNNPLSKDLIAMYRETAYCCANIVANAVASVPYHLYTSKPTEAVTKKLSKKDRKWLRKQGYSKLNSLELEEVTEHPLLDFLDNCNPYLDFCTILRLTMLYQLMLDRAFWYVHQGGDEVKAVWILQSHLVNVITSKTKFIESYEYGLTNKKVYQPEQVVMFNALALSDPYVDGYGSARASFLGLQQLELDTSLANSLMANRGRPDLLVSPKEAAGQTAINRLTERIRQMFSGGRNGLPLVSNIGALDVKELGYTSREMEGLPRRKTTQEDVYNAFGVPYALRPGKDTNRATVEAAIYLLMRFTIVPHLYQLYTRLNKQFVPRFGEGLVLWYEDPVVEDEKVKAETDEIKLRCGRVTINDLKREDGEEEVEYGQEPWISSTLTQPSIAADERQFKRDNPAPPPGFPVANAPKDPEAAVEADTEDTGTQPKAMLYKVLEAYYSGGLGRNPAILALRKMGVAWPKAFDWTTPQVIVRDSVRSEGAPHAKAMPIPSSEPLAKVLRATFRKQRAEVLSSFKSVWEDRVKGISLTRRINLDKWDKKLAEEAMPALELMYQKAGRTVLARIGVSDSFNVTQPAVKTSIEKAALKFAESTNSTTSQSINDAIENLRQQLLEGVFEDRDTPAELAKRVAEIFDSAEEYRADRIAATESSRATHAGQRLAAKQSGVVKGFEWLLSAEPCEICEGIAADTKGGISLDESFGEVGDNPYYKTVDSPPAHPNCMCSMIEILKDDYAPGDDTNGE